ncbi:hypothetical protein FDH01_gp056 [Acinetobacter phage vB_AbaM_ME3]|uniref:Uncharacterized protein n=1 Tax=Acinetobacter phage vB_AbaM_ME3 TaxID=1837876 RepID=A0A172Q047_9CAUD|nr:hypothetical protein FDH01_gp056 [Acinetobacter phage vB_AbaM_ME3]AND75217.1 hypothetical protein ME3_56 [Acinetobacter phage vB_AbaM_ME3]
MNDSEVYTFKVRYYLDRDSIQELNSLSHNELMDILQRLYISSDKEYVEITLSLSSSGGVNILFVDDYPIVKNQFITLYNGEVTDESEY